MSLPIVWHPGYIAPLRDGHRFPMSKYGYLRDLLVARGLLPAIGGYIAPAPAGIGLLARVHALDYVERAVAARLTAAEERRIGLPGTLAMAARARLASAGTLLAARLALDAGIACNLAGGSHHAGPEGGAGFCVFNDVGVAARALLDEGQVARVLVVDCDVHQGDGTARIFAGEPRVFTLSLHAAGNYPADKATSSLDIALPDGMGDAAYLAALDGALTAVLARPGPDIAFYNAGVDVAAGDRLGRLSLTADGIRARDTMVLARLRGAGIPVACVLGGGYGTDPGDVAARHAILIETAAAACT